MQNLQVGLLTRKKLVSKEEGRIILNLVCNTYPDVAPEVYGIVDPIRKVFHPDHVEEALEEWGDGFFWKRKHPRVEGGVMTGWGPTPLHGSITLDFAAKDAAKADIPSLVRFLEAASVRLLTDFAFVHILTKHDIVFGTPNDTVFCLDPQRNRHNLYVTTHNLVKHIPDLYWGTVFGPPYVEHFGRQHLLSAPAPIIREFAGGGIYLQLSESPLDLHTNFTKVETVRRQVKAHLNHNAFYVPDAPAGHLYSVPDFPILYDPEIPLPSPDVLPDGQLRFDIDAVAEVRAVCLPGQVDPHEPEGVLLAFFAAMNAWEIRSWQRFQQNQQEGAHPDWMEQAREEVQAIFTQYCTSKQRHPERQASFRHPPEYDPATEKIFHIDKTKTRATLYTQQTTGFQHPCRYILVKKKDRWWVNDKQIIHQNGTLINAVL